MIITTLRNFLAYGIFAVVAACGGGGGGGSSPTPGNTGGNAGTSAAPPPSAGSPPPTCSSDVATAANSAPNAATVKTLLTNTIWSGGSKCIDCHGGNGNLFLATGDDWANNLVAVNSFEQPSLKRVKPGDAANSYLIQKLEGAPTISGARMPFGASPLSTAQVDQIKAWINGIALCP